MSPLTFAPHIPPPSLACPVLCRFFSQLAARLTVPSGPSVACSTATAVKWDAAWANNLDPSGRAALGVHNAAYDNAENGHAEAGEDGAEGKESPPKKAKTDQ